jgi:K+-sensing histidine kinase KdpD
VTDRDRPSADRLLEKLKQQDRARLRVYIGAAPGVGKTYRMLTDGKSPKDLASTWRSGSSNRTAAPRRRPS